MIVLGWLGQEAVGGTPPGAQSLKDVSIVLPDISL